MIRQHRQKYQFLEWNIWIFVLSYVDVVLTLLFPILFGYGIKYISTYFRKKYAKYQRYQFHFQTINMLAVILIKLIKFPNKEDSISFFCSHQTVHNISLNTITNLFPPALIFNDGLNKLFNGPSWSLGRSYNIFQRR